jgi:hypothetical protein
MAVTAPEWLVKRGGSLQAGPYGDVWFVMLQGAPQYKITPIPVAGRDGCIISQTINGKIIDCTAKADNTDAAVQGALEDLRKALGW